MLQDVQRVKTLRELLEQLSIQRPQRHAGSEKKCQLRQDCKIDYANILFA